MATGAVICAEIFHPDRYATPRFREARINGVDKILYFPEYDAFRVNIQWPNHSLSVFVQAGDQVAQAPDGNIEPAGDEEIAGDEETTDDEETFGNEETAIDEETGGNGVQLHRRNRRDFSVLPDFLSELWKRLTQTTCGAEISCPNGEQKLVTTWKTKIGESRCHDTGEMRCLLEGLFATCVGGLWTLQRVCAGPKTCSQVDRRTVECSNRTS
ncbi:MAG: hypothetical protein SGCHY_004302 [Lobulomycetales sp.]